MAGGRGTYGPSMSLYVDSVHCASSTCCRAKVNQLTVSTTFVLVEMDEAELLLAECGPKRNIMTID